MGFRTLLWPLKFGKQVVVVHSLSHFRLFATPWTAAPPVFPVLYQLPEFTQTHIHWVGVAIHQVILFCPLLLPSIFSSIRVFSSESALCIRWPKYWNFSFSISPSSEYSGKQVAKIKVFILKYNFFFWMLNKENYLLWLLFINFIRMF